MESNQILPEDEAARKAWLSDLSRTIENVGPGVVLLAVQITHLENKCRAMRLEAAGRCAKANARLVKAPIETRFRNASSLGPSLRTAASRARGTARSRHSEWYRAIASIDSLFHFAVDRIISDIREVMGSMRSGATRRCGGSRW